MHLEWGATSALVTSAVERFDHEIELACRVLDPMHAVRSGLMVEFYGLPVAGAIGGGGEVENGSAVHRVSRVPLAADG